MNRTIRVGVLLTALLSLFAIGASTASAVTWHNTGNTTFTATGGATTLSSTGVTIACTGADVAGTAPGGSVIAATWVASGTAQFTGCRMAGISATVTCDYSGTGTSWVAGPPGVTSGAVDIRCTSIQGGTPVCITEGQVAGTYTNPTGATRGIGNLPASNTVRVTNANGGNCPLGNGDAVTLTAGVYTITTGTGGSGTAGPIVTRTP